MDRRFPRLNAAHAKVAISQLQGKTREQLQAASRAFPDLATERFAATGFPRVSSQELIELGHALRTRVEGAGYPDDSAEARNSVDKELAKVMSELDLPVGEMLRPDTWAWLSVYLLPDYLFWRWGKPDGTITEVRVSGPVLRSALGRLWLRGVVFDRGSASPERWDLIERIPEDAALAILERTTVSSDHRLARAVAQAWLNTGSSGTAAEALLRRTMIRIRVQAALIETSALSDSDLWRFAEVAFAQDLSCER